MHKRFLDLRSPVKITSVDSKINNPLSEAEYVVLAAVFRALKSSRLCPKKLCSRDVTLLGAGGVFSFIIEELYEQNSVFD